MQFYSWSRTYCETLFILYGRGHGYELPTTSRYHHWVFFNIFVQIGTGILAKCMTCFRQWWCGIWLAFIGTLVYFRFNYLKGVIHVDKMRWHIGIWFIDRLFIHNKTKIFSARGRFFLLYVMYTFKNFNIQKTRLKQAKMC